MTFKFILYVLLGFLIIRFIMRLMSPRVHPQQKEERRFSKKVKSPKHIDEPKFNISAESVDYEIIEEEEETEKEENDKEKTDE